ncbi:CDP-alcohol phosphatidyltransferase family protein [Gellertiella hungarica]|uniref:CDP-diacylglycerol--glycerol-3-phosphate 3-phosphatidyltransferase n=1 Tax=Gellertiella hungarica TaxID=1572859 RepID=A0A7W6J671_9HYPH|nr:CDP-alcohol phosphatidyltransferase family protein [Gellertiella hungarica]MBB4065518.1 cardiolipin synthase [Gellertiella hungarica]
MPITIPNIITIARFLLVPAVIYALAHGEMVLAFALFVTAGVSDAVDGFIARHFNQRSELGAWLDPLADKLLLVSVFVMLGVLGELPDWLIFLVVSRDVLIIGAVVLASVMDQPMEADPILVSKASTAAQITLAAVALAAPAFALEPGVLLTVLIGLVAVLTTLSAASYFRIWMRHMGVSGRSSGE